MNVAFFRLALALGAGLALSTPASLSHARSAGISAPICEGCHGSPVNGVLQLKAATDTLQPGQRVELTLSIVGSYATGGAYIVTTGDVGTLEAIANQGLTKSLSGLSHNQPKAASGGSVQFRFAWTAPAAPGAVRFEVAALGANGNRAASGDAPLTGVFDFVYGCEPQDYYLDGDVDGIGRDDFPLTACVDMPPPSYSAEKGDCDDYRKTTFPGATEVCNLMDDDCDGQVDEDAEPVELWPDADGDGYYDLKTEMVGEAKIGCVGLKGWAAEPGDCRPMDATVNPGATEVCNGVDDDCDGSVDERVRPACGEGWCRRESPSCDATRCVPGRPDVERCNFLDDDCDGEVDEGDLCGAGRICGGGGCVDAPDVPPGGTSGSGNSSGGSGSGSVGVAGASSTSGGTDAQSGAESGTAGRPGGPVNETASGCALGHGTSHGALAALTLLCGFSVWRRRRGAPRGA